MPKGSERLRLDNLGAFGLVRDVQDYELQPEAWSYLKNARMSQRGIAKVLHNGTLVSTPGHTVTGADRGLWLFHVKDQTNEYWVSMGQKKAYATAVGPTFTVTNLTPGVDFTADQTRKWNGGMFQGFLVANNGVEVPYFWNLNTVNDFVKISTLGSGADQWPATTTAGIIVPFREYLVALDITKSGVRNPHLVKWSHPAVPNSLPTSWDETNPQRDAGEYPLTDSKGIIVDAAALKQSLVIYKEDCSWLMSWIGGNDVFRFDPGLKQQGLLANHLVTPFGKDSDRHFCVGSEDIYVYDGRQAQSVVEERLREAIFSLIDPDNFDRSFVMQNPRRQEVWFCFPEVGQLQPTLAAIWNWKDNKWGIREINPNSQTDTERRGSPCIQVGTVLDSSSEPWSGDSSTWDTDVTPWDQRSASPVTQRLVALQPLNNAAGDYRLRVIDDGTKIGFAEDVNTNVYECIFERTGLAITDKDNRGQWKTDLRSEKIIQTVWPKCIAPPGTEIFISIATQQNYNDNVQWSAEQSFIVGTDEFVDFYEVGRLFGIRFRQSGDTGYFTLSGYEIDVTPVGEF